MISMTKRESNNVLDECLTLVEEGRVTIVECLARYPDHAADLRPLLEIALEMRRVPRPTSSPASFAAGKRRMLKALAEKKRRQPNWFSHCVKWIVAPFGERRNITARRRAPAFQLALATTAVLVIFAVGGLLLQSWLGTPVTRMVTLEAMNGVVQVLPAGSETWLPPSAVEQLKAGDRIRTGPLSAATLSFFDGSVTNLEAETEITIVQMSAHRDGNGKTIVLHQSRGRSRHSVRPLRDPASHFEVKTPTAVAVVRGTEFTIAVETDGTTQVVVRKGFVEVTAREMTVEVQPGQMTNVQPDLPPDPVVLAPTPSPSPTFRQRPQCARPRRRSQPGYSGQLRHQNRPGQQRCPSRPSQPGCRRRPGRFSQL